MTRIYVTEPDTDNDYYVYEDGPNGPQRRAGFFSSDAATYWHGNKEVFDGANLADVNTRDQGRGQGLYRTAQGRWVLRTWSNWVKESDTYTYASDTDARDWLLFNEYNAEVKEYFGEPEQERGPGRPEVGGKISVSLGDVLEPLDAYAKQNSVSRAEALRQLTTEALEADRPYALQYHDASGFKWENLETYTRPGDALVACDAALDDEEDWLPKGRHRVVDLASGSILSWTEEMSSH